MQESTSLWTAVISACSPMLAFAQPAAPTRQATQLPSRLAFADYRPFQEPKPETWRAINNAFSKEVVK